MSDTITKEEILKVIYPVTSANYFNVDKTSYLYKQAEEVADKLLNKIKEKHEQ